LSNKTRTENKYGAQHVVSFVAVVTGVFSVLPHETNGRKYKYCSELHEKNVGIVLKGLEAKFETKLKEKESVIQNLRERVMKLEVKTDVSNSFPWKITRFEEKLRTKSCSL